MKRKSITFRPKTEHRQRLDRLAEATERPITWLVEKAIEDHLPELERRYAAELADLEKRQRITYNLRGQQITRTEERAAKSKATRESPEL